MEASISAFPHHRKEPYYAADQSWKVVVDGWGRGELFASCPEGAGGYPGAGITLEQFPEEPRIDSARVVLRADLQGS